MVGNVCGHPIVSITYVVKIDRSMEMMSNVPSAESRHFLMKKA
jgi:hypothetical protein